MGWYHIDPRVSDLAVHALVDHPGADAAELAKRIQELVDDFIEFEVPAPCPRCGAAPKVSQADAYASVYCERCYNGDPGDCGGGVGRLNAVEEWNRLVENWDGDQ